MSYIDTLCPRPLDDLIIDKLVTALEAFSTAQVALSASVGFKVTRDQLRPYTQNVYPLVNVWSGKTSSPTMSKKGGTELATINLDMFTRAYDTAAQPTTSKHYDQKNMARLYYLREQVKRAIFDLYQYDFQFPAGASGPVIAGKSLPSWELFLNEGGFPDDSIIAGRLSFDVTYLWNCDDSNPVVPYSETRIDANYFAGLYPKP